MKLICGLQGLKLIKGSCTPPKMSSLSKPLGTIQLKDMICYLSLLEGGRPEDKLECKITYYTNLLVLFKATYRLYEETLCIVLWFPFGSIIGFLKEKTRGGAAIYCQVLSHLCGFMIVIPSC